MQYIQYLITNIISLINFDKFNFLNFYVENPTSIDNSTSKYFSEGLIAFLSTSTELVIEQLTRLFIFLPPINFILIVIIGFYYFSRMLGHAIVIGLSLSIIYYFGFWEQSIQTISLVLVSTFVTVVIGVPVGIFLGHHPYLYRFIGFFLDAMQTIPTLIYLIPGIILFGLGVTPALVATVIFALPTTIRITAVGIQSVPKDLITLGKAFGANRYQIMTKIEIPHALPAIMAGLNQCVVLSLSMVVIAAQVGGKGLGQNVLVSLNTVDWQMGLEVGLSVASLAVCLDRLFRIENYLLHHKKTKEKQTTDNENETIQE